MPLPFSLSVENPPLVNNTQADEQYRILWMNVLLRATEEARGVNCIIDRTCTKEQLVRAAREWLTEPGESLELVCEWAGVPVQRVLEEFQRLYGRDHYDSSSESSGTESEGGGHARGSLPTEP